MKNFRKKKLFTPSLKGTILHNLILIRTFRVNVGGAASPNLAAILIGKFILGLASGAMIVACSLYLNETVPVEHASTFGFTTNFGVICGIMLCLVMGVALPDPKTDPQACDDNTFWIYMNAFPALIGALNLVLWLFVFKYESVKTYVVKSSSAPSNAQIGSPDSGTSKDGSA